MKGRHIPYSSEEMAWLFENRTLPIAEYHAAFVARFARTDVAPANLHALRKRKGWRTGRTGCFAKGHQTHNKGKPFPAAATHPNCRKAHFRKGQLPHNTRALGHERVSVDGYVEISIDEPNPHTGFERRFVLKHRWLWERANGPVPDGHALKCLDGNRLNTDPANWQAVLRAMLPRLAGGNRYRRVNAYDEAPAALRPTIMATARLDHAARELKRKRRDGGA